MKLFEYEAKELARKYNIPVPQGFVASTPEAAREAFQKLNRPSMIKAQVLVAGRGKAGGIKPATTPQEAFTLTQSMLMSTVKGEKVSEVLVEERVDGGNERYASIVADRSGRCYTVLCSAEGGMDIEQVAEQHPEKIVRYKIDPLLGLQDFECRIIARRMGYSGGLMNDFATVLSQFYRLTIDYDAELVESNPLIETRQGRLVAGDLRILLDDNSLFRHLEFTRRTERSVGELTALEAKAEEMRLAYVELDGDIGIVGNGAGLVMATLDLISDFNGAPANFCDVGGGASEDRIRTALEIVLSNPKVKALLVNIMGGITRCDDVAKAILNVMKEMKITAPIAIRLVGTNEAEGQRILEDAKIPYLKSMDEAASTVVELAASRR